VWSLGGNIPIEGRNLLNNYLGKKVAEYNAKFAATEKELHPREESRTYFDVCIN
jgi:hypothetical protein